MKTSRLTAAIILFLGTAVPAIVASADEAVAFKPLGLAEWRDKLKGYPPDIVVVDMWATWCVSCIERFPKMVELHHRYHHRGVRFVSMCLDERDDKAALARAEKFLQKQRAVFENYWMDEKLLHAFDELNLIGIPAVIIYDGQGRERYRLTGDNPNRQFSDQDVEQAIKQLLAGRDAAPVVRRSPTR